MQVPALFLWHQSWDVNLRPPSLSFAVPFTVTLRATKQCLYMSQFSKTVCRKCDLQHHLIPQFFLMADRGHLMQRVQYLQKLLGPWITQYSLLLEVEMVESSFLIRLDNQFLTTQPIQKTLIKNVPLELLAIKLCTVTEMFEFYVRI